MKRNYPTWLRFNSRDYFLFWQTDTEGDAPDRFLTQPETTRFLWAGNQQALRTLAAQHELTLEDQEPNLMDLDAPFRVLANLRPGRATYPTSCHDLLDGWNTLEDLAYSLGISRDLHEGKDKEILAKAYDRTFWGSNLPAVTPTGESWHPVFDTAERKAMRRYLRQLWQAILKYQPFAEPDNSGLQQRIK